MLRHPSASASAMRITESNSNAVEVGAPQPIDPRLCPGYHDDRLTSLQSNWKMRESDIVRAASRDWSKVPTCAEGIELQLVAKMGHMDNANALWCSLLKNNLKINRLSWTTTDDDYVGVAWKTSVRSMLGVSTLENQHTDDIHSTLPENRPRHSIITVMSPFANERNNCGRTHIDKDIYESVNDGSYDWPQTEPTIDAVVEGKALVLRLRPDTSFPTIRHGREKQDFNEESNNNCDSPDANVLVEDKDDVDLQSIGFKKSIIWPEEPPFGGSIPYPAEWEYQMTRNSLSVLVFDSRDITVIFQGMADASAQTGVPRNRLKRLCKEVNLIVDDMLRLNPHLNKNSTRKGERCFMSDSDETTEKLLDALSRVLDCKHVSWDCQFDPSLIPAEKVGEGADGDWEMVEDGSAL